MKKNPILIIITAILMGFIAASCGTSEPTYKKNSGLKKTSHSTVAKTSNGVFCKK